MQYTGGPRCSATRPVSSATRAVALCICDGMSMVKRTASRADHVRAMGRYRPGGTPRIAWLLTPTSLFARRPCPDQGDVWRGSYATPRFGVDAYLTVLPPSWNSNIESE